MAPNNVSGDVIIGSGLLYVAPIGTALPTIDGSVYPIVWTNWKAVGYTMDGVEVDYTPTFKDIMVDEEMSPIKKPLVGEKVIIRAKLAQATIINLQRVIAGSKVSSLVGSPDDNTTLKLGGSQLDNQLMIGFEGPAPSTQQTRVIIAYKAKAIGSIAMKFQRTAPVELLAEFEALADGTKPAGEHTLLITDIGTQIES